MIVARRVHPSPWTSCPAGPVAIAAVLALLVSVALLHPRLRVYALELVLLPLFLVLSRLTFSGLLEAYVWMTSLVHLLKRAVFLLGDQPRAAYYSTLLLPTLLYVPLLALALGRARGGLRRPSTRLLFLFGAWSLVITLLPNTNTPVSGRLAAVHERLLPLLAFVVGLAVHPRSKAFSRVARALIASAALSVVYGVLLFASGPTFLERRWAEATAEYSLQGRNVLAHVLGRPGAEEWRSFSYLADPLTWGMFLLAAVAAALALREAEPSALRPRRLRAVLAVLGSGLVLCMTRTPWVGLLVMLISYAALGRRFFRRPAVLFGVVLSGMAVIVTLGTFLYATVAPLVRWSEIASHPILLRYLTLGTLEARIGAWEAFQGAVRAYPVVGEGFAYGEYFLRAMSGSSVGEAGGHNFLLETTVCTGVVGLLLLLGFLYHLLREGLLVLEDSGHHRAVRWLISFIVGFVMTGYLNGGSFLNVYFFLLAGVLAGARGGWPREGEGA